MDRDPIASHHVFLMGHWVFILYLWKIVVALRQKKESYSTLGKPCSLKEGRTRDPIGACSTPTRG